MGVLKNLTEEYFKNTMRKEEGVFVNINGERYSILFKDYDFVKDLYPMNDNGDLFVKKEFDFLGDPVYMCSAYKEGSEFIEYYYISEPDLENVENNNINENLNLLVRSEYYDMEETFKFLNVLYHSTLYYDYVDFDDGITLYEEDHICRADCNREIYIFDDEDKANEYATESVKEILEGKFSSSMSKKQVERYRRGYGDSWIDEDALKEWYEEDRGSYYDEIESEPGEHGNRLFDEMIEAEVIEDTSEYFETTPTFDVYDYQQDLINNIVEEKGCSVEEAEEMVDSFDEDDFLQQLIYFEIVDEDDEDYFELDYSKPKFNIEDKKEEMKNNDVEGVGDIIDVEGVGDIIYEILLNFGELYASYYDLEKLAELIVEEDGRGPQIATYDGEEYTSTYDDVDYLLYIR